MNENESKANKDTDFFSPIVQVLNLLFRSLLILLTPEAQIALEEIGLKPVGRFNLKACQSRPPGWGTG